MKHGAAADAVDSDAVNQVSLTVSLPCAYGASEEAQGIGLNGWETKPADVNSDAARLLHWQQCYGALWEFKLSFEKQHNR